MNVVLRPLLYYMSNYKLSTLLKFTSIGSTSTYKHINHFVTTKGQAKPKLEMCWCNSGNFNLKLKKKFNFYLIIHLLLPRLLEKKTTLWLEDMYKILKCKRKVRSGIREVLHYGFVYSAFFTVFFLLQLKIPQVVKSSQWLELCWQKTNKPHETLPQFSVMYGNIVSPNKWK